MQGDEIKTNYLNISHLAYDFFLFDDDYWFNDNVFFL